MESPVKTLRTCEKGHQYTKSTDCPTCPVCENERKPKNGFLSKLSAPACRALEREGIDSLEKLAMCTEKQILQLHGIGRSTIPVLKQELEALGLSFKS